MNHSSTSFFNLVGLLKPNQRLALILNTFYLVPSTSLISSPSILLVKTITLSYVVTNSISAVKKSKSANKLKSALILQAAQATTLLLLLSSKDSPHHEIFGVIFHLRLMNQLHQPFRVTSTTPIYQPFYLCILTECLVVNQSLSEIQSR